MTPNKVSMQVRQGGAQVNLIDIRGDVNGAAEGPLMKAFEEASQGGTRTILLNFTGLEYMNSSGIGLLVTVLIRANRQKQRLMAFGLSEHYKQIFELTRLNEAIRIFESEAEAIAAARA